MTACPSPLPRWWDDFTHWREHGGIPAERPGTVPKRVPAWAWSCFRERHPVKPKPVYQLPFVPPVAFYRAPDDLTVGITEMLAVWKGDVAIDPLAEPRSGWDDLVTACRVRGRKVYGWTRVTSSFRCVLYDGAAPLFNLTSWFPNIEDDDLRAAAPDVTGFLNYVSRSPTEIVGVLTNYNVSSLWPKDHPLSHLPVLPEWFPSEIHDPTATLEGSLDSGRKHFAAALPLLDGRERGLAAFPYPAGAYCVWPADNVTDWRAWVR